MDSETNGRVQTLHENRLLLHVGNTDAPVTTCLVTIVRIKGHA